MTDQADSRGQILECLDCSMWELRYRVAARVSYDLAIRLHEPELRQQVLEDITAGWRRHCETDATSDNFDAYFTEYLAVVERDIDRTTHDVDREWRRLWAEHAWGLVGD